jgi:DNA repair exonuclease SbcCD ATPase subunit
MNIVQFIRERIQAREGKGASGVQDLVLYRQLRRTESKLFEARENLGRALALQKQAVAEHARIAQACDEPGQPLSAGNKSPTLDSGPEQRLAVSLQQDMSPQLEELQKKIAFLKSDINRLETEYQQVQMNVRTYFYLETCPGRLPEAGVTAGQPAQ